MTNLSATSFFFPNCCSVIDRQHLCHLKTPCCDGWDIQGQSLSCGFKAFSCTTLLPGLVLAFAWQPFSSLHLRLAPFLGSSIVLQFQKLVVKILKEYCAWFCQAVWLNLFLLLYCFVNLISKSASWGEGCCIIVENSIRTEVVVQPWIVSLHKRLFPEWVKVERDIKLQGRVLMKMINPNQDKVKRLLLLQLDAQVPDEFKQPSPNRRIRNWEWYTLCSLCSQSKFQSSSTKSSFIYCWQHCQTST